MKNSNVTKLLHREMTRKEFLTFSALGVISLFGIGGVITELLTRAATPPVSTEAEDGTLANGATVVSNSSASGGKEVRFGTPPAIPVNTTEPSISGTDTVGSQLSANTGVWSNAPTAYSYVWKHIGSGTTATVSTASTYTLQSSDVGDTITVTVTASNAAGSASATSSATGTIVANSSTTALALGVAIGDGAAFMASSDKGLAQYKRMKSLGINSVRIDGNDYSNGAVPVYCDPIIQTALTAGLEVLLIIDDYFEATNAAQFVTFCTNVVKHYAPQGVHYYEVMNEINIGSNDLGGTADPVGYTGTLKQCYAAIHAADSEAKVLFSGQAGGLGDGGANLSPPTFVAKCYAAMTNNSSTGYYDIMNVHVYSYPSLPNINSYTWQECLNPGTAIPGGLSGYPSVRQQMIQHGDTNKPIWITEFGAPTGTTDGYTPVSVAAEANMFTTGYSVLEANNLNFVERMYAYKWQDDNDDDFGLLNTSYGDKTVAAGSYSGQPSGVTTVLEAFLQGAQYSSAFTGNEYP